MTRGRQTVLKIHFRERLISFCLLLIASNLFMIGIFPGIINYSVSGEELLKPAKSVIGRATASESSDGQKVVFTMPDGTVVRSIPVVKKKVESSKTPSGNITLTSQDIVQISNDRSHVAIFTLKYEYAEGDVNQY